jgi:hypothetical protein
MTKAELAQIIDAYADSKVSGNKYLVERMIGELNVALEEVCDSGGGDMPPVEIPSPPHQLPPLTPPSFPEPDRVLVGAQY